MNMNRINAKGLDILFRTARSQNAWLDRPLPEGTPEAIYELMQWGPTSANCSPARFVFCVSEDSKARLAGVAMEGNRAKIKTAPACVIIAHDEKFYTELPRLFPHNPAFADLYAGNAPLAQATAFRNSSLQGAYFMLAARALGLDCGPMSGFDNAALDAEFFAGTTLKSNFICGIGFGDSSAVFDRLPRLSFDEACQLL